ncbi:MAG: AMP-binding protein, partial [Clostridia bacterium]|nr:AMP-binding protein [Clostridia bacterium]
IIEDILERKGLTDIPPVAALPDDSLYTVFTSGSTGTPKGAVVSNRSAVNRVQWMCRRFFDHNTVVMLKTPFTFDVSVWEIFGFALGGFSLYILPAEDHYRQDRVIKHIRKGKVTDLHFVPTVFSCFLDALEKDGGELPSLKNFYLSGEALNASLVNRAPAPVHNLYGPTECAGDVTSYDCVEKETDPVPIGKPIDNCIIYVLDKRLQPMPDGVVGQICIGGIPVGCGYVNDPLTTSKSFVKNPFDEGNLYLTGDFGYWRDDGQLIYVGRTDQQVKINGQRIELGEIEAALSTFVANPTVIVQNNRLISFYTGNEQADLREKLSHILPRHMIPHSFVRVDKIPLTESGKLDRRFLPRINQKKNPPQSPVEMQICSLFSEVLDCDSPARDDNFFDLGGTSLQAMELLSSFPLDSLSASDLMTYPTPAQLADLLDSKKRDSVIIPLYIPENAESALFLFPYGGGDAAAYTDLVREFRKRSAPVSLFFVPWGCDYDAAASELQKFKLPVQFYSHCAGAVIALKLLDLVNAENVIVKRFIAGANIPPEELNNIWSSLPDQDLLSVLYEAGMPALPPKNAESMIRDFRSNTEEYYNYFQNKTSLTPVSLSLILSRNDLFTQNHSEAKSIWKRYVSDVSVLKCFECKTHYFQSLLAKELADIILEKEI